MIDKRRTYYADKFPRCLTQITETASYSDPDGRITRKLEMELVDDSFLSNPDDLLGMAMQNVLELKKDLEIATEQMRLQKKQAEEWRQDLEERDRKLKVLELKLATQVAGVTTKEKVIASLVKEHAGLVSILKLPDAEILDVDVELSDYVESRLHTWIDTLQSQTEIPLASEFQDLMVLWVKDLMVRRV